MIVSITNWDNSLSGTLGAGPMGVPISEVLLYMTVCVHCIQTVYVCVPLYSSKGLDDDAINKEIKVLFYCLFIFSSYSDLKLPYTLHFRLLTVKRLLSSCAS